MLHALVLPDSITGHADVAPTMLDCSWKDDGSGVAWVDVVGELDIATAPQLERTLRDAQRHARLVVLDLRELAFMDSAGVHAIVRAGIRARQVGRRLLVLSGPPHVDRIFTLTGRRNAVEIHHVGSGPALAQLAEEALVS